MFYIFTNADATFIDKEFAMVWFEFSFWQFAGKMLIVLFIACRLKYYEAEPEINLSHE